jgi:hypothetical protein
MSHLIPSSRGSSTCAWYNAGRKVSDKNLEQWIYINFYVKMGKSTSETALITLVYGEYIMKTRSVFEWFRKRRKDVQYDPRSWQPRVQS